jgi:type I restriction enzyme S subunit
MAEQPRVDISPQNWQIVRDILQHHVPELEVWAFGSRAQCTAKPFSDLDIAIIGSEKRSVGLVAEVREAFQESALPFKVDIVDWAATDERFRKIIEQCAVVLQEGKVRD